MLFKKPKKWKKDKKHLENITILYAFFQAII